MNEQMNKQYCKECKFRSVRRIVHTSEPSVYTKVPKKTCGHEHGFNFFYRSSLATDGLCNECYKKE